MDIYGIIGYPVKHSLSPAMHNAAFKELGINAEYDVFEVEPTHLEDFFRVELRKMPIKGLSVTIPHKVACIDLLDEVRGPAKDLGAVNTIKNENGRLIGENYDWIGIHKPLIEAVSLDGKHVLICGAGGAARAAAYAVKQENISSLTALVRDKQKYSDFAAHFDCNLESFENAADLSPDIIINCTPIGMAPNTESPIPKEMLKKNMVVFEAIYKPLETPLIKDAMEVGATVVTGEKMLLNQAIGQFEWWTNKKAPATIMQQVLLKKLS